MPHDSPVTNPWMAMQCLHVCLCGCPPLSQLEKTTPMPSPPLMPQAWMTMLPVAVCIGRSLSHWHADNAMKAACNASGETYQGIFSPLACLIVAYEILQLPSALRGRLDDATNKAILILLQLVDPAVGQALVTNDLEIPWGLAALFED